MSLRLDAARPRPLVAAAVFKVRHAGHDAGELKVPVISLPEPKGK